MTLTSNQAILLFFADEVTDKAQYTQIPLSRNSTNSKVQYCAKVMQTYFAEIRDFSWLCDEKISNSRWKRIFNEKSR